VSYFTLLPEPNLNIKYIDNEEVRTVGFLAMNYALAINYARTQED